MTGRVWSVALVASLGLHGVGLAALSLSVEPEPLPDQPVPRSQFSIEAAEVPRSRAAPAAPQRNAAPQLPAGGSQAQSGAIRQSRAAALAPASSQVSTKRPAAARLRDTSTDATQQVTDISAKAAPLAAAATPTPVLGSAALTKPRPLISAKVPSAVVLSTAKAPASRPAVRPKTAPAPVVDTSDGPAVPSTPPASFTAREAPANATDSAALPLPATAGTAALAWSGAETTPVSETSLAAIAAFTQQGDLAAASAEVRDGIEGILAAVPCARLQTTFLPDTGQLEVRGHIPEDALRGPVLAALRAQVGEAIALSDQLLILPRPQCGALAGIANAGLPQSTEQLTNPAVIGEDGFARTYTYRDGDRLQLDLVAPDYDSYLYVDYFTADGSVIHLQPNSIVPLEFAPAKSTQSVGRPRADAPFLELAVSPPFGQEIAAAFAASVPLYEGTRPIQEPAGVYLDFLKQQVAAARAAHPDFKGEWVYFFITTTAN